jgi:hypothetical protein
MITDRGACGSGPATSRSAGDSSEGMLAVETFTGMDGTAAASS